ncbi:2-dehydropantoate 2-reductase [Aquibacillus sp. 3ASR75-11]|uniref:2-dehydropantoate 2-reductase n=1 Tax=Terrihalobacillus insolitus TaxID=2950438 RepID=A0A9X4AL15_9BACI|nr:2-dehydropantoate 2-reductase [Terrihalobacillus insolitus]MDC3412822.1 2-dehydropantoate 2-reductase [Terrihalobacillus insolitus]MDC3423701.1 2-dehydropantoate 2-reductase [Terrihalobacillus insolitus]
MNIGIVGAGSVGLLVGSWLAMEHHQVTFYVRRDEQKNAINQNGITLLPSNNVIPVKARLLSEVAEEALYFICVKQYDINEVLSAMDVTKIKGSLVFLQNGMSHVDYIKSRSLRQPIVLGIVEHGSFKKDDLTVEHTGAGAIRLAHFTGKNGFIDELIQSLHIDAFPFVKADDWYTMLAEKLVVNAVINPITALFQVKNGMIVDNPYLHDVARTLCEEATKALGLSGQRQWERVKSIILNTSENESSMLKDVKERRKTEIDGISGYLLRLNQELPTTSFVFQSIKAIEWGWKEG